MARENFNELLAFVNVAREGSFTRAAALMGVSTSALSHAISRLEARLGVGLLMRRARNVSTTEVGKRLFESVAQRFEEIDAHLADVAEARDKPAGTVRITAAEHAANSVLWPKLSKMLQDYPDINVEVTVDYTLSDIVLQRYDAGVRLGDQVAKDMIAVRIGPDQRMAVVGSCAYFARRGRPKKPGDLSGHNCINLRLPTHGSLLSWDFEKAGQKVIAHVKGQWTFNSSSPILRAALAGYGLAFLPEDMVLEHIVAKRLIRALDDWCQPYPGYYLYYPSRRQSSRALAVIVEALRHRG
jgi:DNA-binding transcriptional LysR family regulator